MFNTVRALQDPAGAWRPYTRISKRPDEVGSSGVRSLTAIRLSGVRFPLTLLLLILLCTCVRAQSLDSLKAELRRENPELRALQLDYEAALKIGGQLDQLPDLEIGAGVFILPVETTQMLPWPGKLAAMAGVADARARPLLEKVAARQLMLI